MNLSPQHIAIIGASGAIGRAFSSLLSQTYPHATLYAFSRQGAYNIDYDDEASIAAAANLASRDKPLDMVLVANGILHDGDIMPEKSLKELQAEKFNHLFMVNTVIPAMIAKYFLPVLRKDRPAIFAALSARVGSISDNHIGGWYSYRASKAALNMVIKNAAIEIKRSNKNATIIGLHPGTVDSNLSKPFQGNVPQGKLFTPDYAAQCMLHVLQHVTPAQSGLCFAWDGQEIAP